MYFPVDTLHKCFLLKLVLKDGLRGLIKTVNPGTYSWSPWNANIHLQRLTILMPF